MLPWPIQVLWKIWSPLLDCPSRQRVWARAESSHAGDQSAATHRDVSEQSAKRASSQRTEIRVLVRDDFCRVDDGATDSGVHVSAQEVVQHETNRCLGLRYTSHTFLIFTV